MPDNDRQPRRSNDQPAVRAGVGKAALLAVLAAVLMASPSLRGGFLGGDDVQLVRDHVLVNRPSPAHAVKLFTIIHRDLYQPMAMLSFSIDFAVVDWLGYPRAGGPRPPGAWVFHATNVVLHAACAALVVLLLTQISGRVAIGMVAGVIFALHPMGAETVAWLNGRMMLLSTLFLLGSVYSLCRWQALGGHWRIAVGVICAALCMMSKVRISLPILLLIPCLYRGRRPARGWWGVWLAMVAVTGLFAWINAQASASMLEQGAKALGDGRLVRTVAALGWYLTRAVVPVGLSPYHPAYADLDWGDPLAIIGIVTLIAGMAGLLLSVRRTRVGWVGGLWFLASIAVTLPMVPSRNLLIAQRYAYLPNVGLYWIAAAALVAAWKQLRPAHALSGAWSSIAGCTIIACAMLVVSWLRIDDYRDDVRRAARFVHVYPHVAGLQLRYGWALYEADRIDDALSAAHRELGANEPADESECLQLIGLCHVKAGDLQEGISVLERAVTLDKDAALAYCRLGSAYSSANRGGDAIDAYQACVELAPTYNPGLLKLAGLLRSSGRATEARSRYQQVLENNPYDPYAAVALAEMDYAAQRYAAALDRLQSLLTWMPENVAALVDAGLCHTALGDTNSALEVYRRAIDVDPDTGAAVLNLAGLLISINQRPEAQATLDAYLRRHPADWEALWTSAGNLLALGRAGEAMGIWTRARRTEPTENRLLTGAAWTHWMAGDWSGGAELATRAAESNPADPIARCVLCVDALRFHRHDDAIDVTLSLIADGSLPAGRCFDALTALLQAHSSADPDDGWSYFVVAMACQATNRRQLATAAAEEFKRRVADPAEQARMDQQLATIGQQHKP